MKYRILKIFRQWKVRWQRYQAFRYTTYFLATFLALTWILSSNFISNPFRPEFGKQSPMDLLAPRTVDVVDKVATEEARHAAEVSIPLLYTLDIRQKIAETKQIKQLFAEVREIQTQNIPPYRKIAVLRRVIPYPVSEKTLLTLLNSKKTAQNQIETDSLYLLGKVMNTGILKNEIPQARITIERMAKLLPLSGDYADAVTELAEEALQPNKVPDWESMQKQQEEIERRYQREPIMRRIEKGTPVVSKGELITEEKMGILRQLGYFSSSPSYLTLLGMGILSLLFVSILVFYVTHYTPQLFQEEKLLLLLAFLVCGTLLVSKILIPFSGYLAPVAMASILIALLFNGRLSLIVTAFLSLMVGLFTNDLYSVIVAFVGGYVAIFSVSRVTNRFQLTSAVFLVAMANVTAILCFSLLGNESPAQFLQNVSFGGANGLLSVILAILILPILEQFSGVTTPFRLLELANPNSPLLRNLLVECPGTYHHSILVANLAENAAQSVKANPLLVRVGAYYHDIGKMRRPDFFIENQRGGENPHNKLNPTLSTLIVTAHTEDGLEIAKTHKLPREVQEIIVQHHGTQPVNYFYHQAVTKEGADQVNRDDFRHRGPKPQSKEAAILMLSDSVEAAVRSLAKPTPSKIEQTVREVIRGAEGDGQLDECNLTFRDLNILIGTYTRLLTGLYHRRIEYPETYRLGERERQNERRGKILKFGS